LKAPEGSQGAQIGIGAGLFALGLGLVTAGVMTGNPFLIQGGVGLGLSGAGMALGSLLQPPAPKNNSPTGQATSFSLTGTQNGIAQVGQLVPFVAGRWNKVFPLHVAQPYTTWQGSTQYMHCLLSAGLGPLLISNVRIGDTLIDDMKGVTWQLRSGRDTERAAWPGDPNHPQRARRANGADAGRDRRSPILGIHVPAGHLPSQQLGQDQQQFGHAQDRASPLRHQLVDDS
jgi:hypothetical protein